LEVLWFRKRYVNAPDMSPVVVVAVVVVMRVTFGQAKIALASW
jgi:hypothetical protein